MGFNKKVKNVAELNQVIDYFHKSVYLVIEDSVSDSVKSGTGFLQDFIRKNAYWKGTLFGSIKYNFESKYVGRIMITAPHAKIVNEGVEPHMVTRYNKDGSERMSLSGASFSQWLDEHGFSGVNRIIVGGPKSILRKPGLQFTARTGQHISTVLPNILKNNVQKHMR